MRRLRRRCIGSGLAGCAIVFGRGAWLVLVHPDLRVETLGPLDHPVGHMAFGADGRLYYASGTTLYRVDGL